MEKYGLMKMQLFIKNIQQINNHIFEITWSDLSTSKHRLSSLQKACPCAKCLQTEEQSKLLNPDVKAKFLKSIGRYAIKIEFTSGCSAGIYDFDLLYSNKEMEC